MFAEETGRGGIFHPPGFAARIESVICGLMMKDFSSGDTKQAEKAAPQ
jgi:hypothetical protein